MTSQMGGGHMYVPFDRPPNRSVTPWPANDDIAERRWQQTYISFQKWVYDVFGIWLTA